MDNPNETGATVTTPPGGDNNGKNTAPDLAPQAQQAVGEKTGQDSAPAQTATEQQRPEDKPSGAGVWGKIVLLLLLAALVGGGFLGWQWWQQVGPGSSKQGLTAALEQQQGQLDALQGQFDREAQDWAQRFSAQVAHGDALEARLASQEESMRNMSASGREDLILAEAEFLLRLAHQRLLGERRPGAALALLESSDKIFAEVGDAGLFTLRKALAQDISALRLAATVDREGLYLQLVALGEAVTKLQSLPRLTAAATPAAVETAQASVVDGSVVDGSVVDAVEAAPAQPQSRWYAKLLANAQQALRRFSEGYLTIRTLDRPLTPMLSADQELLLNHSLRLALEQAELALLREEQVVYATSLHKAEQWLQTYYQLSPGAQVLITQLQALKAQEVAQQLPDISGSLDAVRRYLRERETRKSTAVATP